MGDQVRQAKEFRKKDSRQENVKRKIKMNEVEPKRIRESMQPIYWRHQVKAPDFLAEGGGTPNQKSSSWSCRTPTLSPRFATVF